jgi:hypothetical protein
LASIDVPSDETIMKSEFVEVVEIAPPPLRPPDVTGAGALESRDRYLPYLRGDYFARGTAVYHLDRCVRTLESIGVNVAEFFAPAAENGTNPPARSGLPIGVDPCVESIAGINMATNAMTLGNASGVEGICIGELVVDAGVTAATDPRLVWHEFGHCSRVTRAATDVCPLRTASATRSRPSISIPIRRSAATARCAASASPGSGTIAPIGLGGGTTGDSTNLRG